MVTRLPRQSDRHPSACATPSSAWRSRGCAAAGAVGRHAAPAAPAGPAAGAAAAAVAKRSGLGTAKGVGTGLKAWTCRKGQGAGVAAFRAPPHQQQGEAAGQRRHGRHASCCGCARCPLIPPGRE
jgi:hypothetical protein